MILKTIIYSLVLLATLSSTGCKTIKNSLNDDINYKASKLEPKLEVPSDLTQLTPSTLYAAGDVMRASALAADKATAKTPAKPLDSSLGLAPK